MFSDYPNIESRLRAQEAMSTMFHAQLHEIKAQMQTFESSVNERFDRFEQSVNAQFKAVDKRFDQFDQAVSAQFDHVYGEFADLKADVAEIRNRLAHTTEIKNMLATLIAKLG